MFLPHPESMLQERLQQHDLLSVRCNHIRVEEVLARNVSQEEQLLSKAFSTRLPTGPTVQRIGRVLGLAMFAVVGKVQSHGFRQGLFRQRRTTL
jgi:hypothetical protein